MAVFVPKNKGPAVISAVSSHTLSDQYRDAVTISYSYLERCPADTTFMWNGKAYNAPIMAGPIGGYQKVHPEGGLAYARAVHEAGSIFWMGFHEPELFRKILDSGYAAMRVIKPLEDNAQILQAIREDTENGAVGYAMDIDHGITPYGMIDAQKGVRFASKTREELRIFAGASPLPFFLKGVLSVHDALIAKEAGCDGIVISGHNNRFPCAVPVLKILPEIRKAVGPEMTILADGGLNNGYDIFKALALGADGTLCARGLLAAFARGGEEGLTQKLLEIGAELKGAMSVTGSVDLMHIDRSAVILP